MAVVFFIGNNGLRGFCVGHLLFDEVLEPALQSGRSSRRVGHLLFDEVLELVLQCVIEHIAQEEITLHMPSGQQR